MLRHLAEIFGCSLQSAYGVDYFVAKNLMVFDNDTKYIIINITNGKFVAFESVKDAIDFIDFELAFR